MAYYTVILKIIITIDEMGVSLLNFSFNMNKKTNETTVSIKNAGLCFIFLKLPVISLHHHQHVHRNKYHYI